MYKHIKLIKFLLFVFCLATFISCSQKLAEDVIAKVDNFEISQLEFQYRYNFNPYLRDIKNQDEAKKIVLSSLIAEKILYLESEKNGLTNENIVEINQQYLKEYMIEHFRRDSVENLIEVSEDELIREYQKSIKEYDIKFVAFQSLDEAVRVKKEIDSTNSFEKPVRKYMNSMGWMNESIPEKKVIWGNEKYELEENIYSLGENQVSNPISAHGEYYLIKAEKIHSVNQPGENDFFRRKPALQDRIIRHKIKQRYSKLFETKLKPRMGSVDWQKMRLVVDVISGEIDFNEKSDQQSLNENKPLSEVKYQSALERIQQNLEEDVIDFPNGKSWSIKDVLKNLDLGPYAFNFKNETLFRRSFARNIELMLEHQAVFEIAQELGYSENRMVQRQYKMWKSYYSSQSQRFAVLDTIAASAGDTIKYKNAKVNPLQNKRLKIMDSYLANIVKEYEIKINKKLFDTINLNKQDMVVSKSHFANRLIAPPLEPLFGLPLWQKKFEQILIDNSLQQIK